MALEQLSSDPVRGTDLIEGFSTRDCCVAPQAVELALLQAAWVVVATLAPPGEIGHLALRQCLARSRTATHHTGLIGLWVNASTVSALPDQC